MRGALLSLVCGLWIAIVVMTAIAATRSLKTVDEILANPPAGSPKMERPHLRYHAAELNRELFRWSEFLQMVLAASVLWLVRRERLALWAAFVCTGILLGQRLYVTREITDLGRQLDFAALPLSAELAALKVRNGMFHGVSVSLDMVKLCGLGVLTFLAIRFAKRDRLAG